MNRYTIQCIIKELFILYQEGVLSQEKFQEIVAKYNNTSQNNNNEKAFEEDSISYKETEIIYLMFKEIPYYKIYDFLKEFIEYLKTLGQNNLKMSCIASLIEGYICENLDRIHRRINTETYAHLTSLLQKFYQKERLEENTITSLRRNMCNPAFLTGMEIASSIETVQLTLEGFTLSKENLGEKISKNNFQKKSNAEYQLRRMVLKYYDTELLERFIEELKAIFEAYKTINPEDAGPLLAIYSQELTNLKKIQKRPAKEQPKDPNQLTLLFT